MGDFDLRKQLLAFCLQSVFVVGLRLALDRSDAQGPLPGRRAGELIPDTERGYDALQVSGVLHELCGRGYALRLGDEQRRLAARTGQRLLRPWEGVNVLDDDPDLWRTRSWDIRNILKQLDRITDGRRHLEHLCIYSGVGVIVQPNDSARKAWVYSDKDH